MREDVCDTFEVSMREFMAASHASLSPARP